jgi:hypothetical protein
LPHPILSARPFQFILPKVVHITAIKAKIASWEEIGWAVYPIIDPRNLLDLVAGFYNFTSLGEVGLSYPLSEFSPAYEFVD